MDLDQEKLYDIAIIGAGPAGLTAALYAARANKEVIIFEKDSVGGQLSQSPLIENFAGQDVPISGYELACKMEGQLEKYKNCILEYSEIKLIKKLEDKTFQLINDRSERFNSRTVILAMGLDHKHLPIANEKELVRSGTLGYCVACDGPFNKGKSVAVIGDGNTAIQTALELSTYCPTVVIISNLPNFPPYADPTLVAKLRLKENIFPIFSETVASIEKSDKATLYNSQGKLITIATGQVFVCIGRQPNTSLIIDPPIATASNYVLSTLFGVTSIDGFFAAGDATNDCYKQAIIAAGSGATAALSALDYLRKS